MRHFFEFFVALGSFVYATFFLNFMEKVWKYMEKYVTLYVFEGKEKIMKCKCVYLMIKK